MKEVQEKTKASIELHICFLRIEGTLGLHYSSMKSKFLSKLIQKEEKRFSEKLKDVKVFSFVILNT